MAGVVLEERQGQRENEGETVTPLRNGFGEGGRGGFFGLRLFGSLEPIGEPEDGEGVEGGNDEEGVVVQAHACLLANEVAGKGGEKEAYNVAQEGNGNARQEEDPTARQRMEGDGTIGRCTYEEGDERTDSAAGIRDVQLEGRVRRGGENGGAELANRDAEAIEQDGGHRDGGATEGNRKVVQEADRNHKDE